MAKKLNSIEEKSQKNLERNMDSLILTYTREKEEQLKAGQRKALEQELTSIDAYLTGCQNSEIADTLTNIRIMQKKKDSLKRILQ